MGSPIDVVLQLVIDDGDIDRDNRKAVFNQYARYLGCNSGMHSRFKFITVLNLSS